jgi:hypothetical protein
MRFIHLEVIRNITYRIIYRQGNEEDISRRAGFPAPGMPHL